MKRTSYQPDMSIYTGIKQDKLPKEWFPFYVVYKYSWAKNTYIVGFDEDTEADKFLFDIVTRKEITRAELFGHFPVQLLKGE